jgi:hypothetical protein
MANPIEAILAGLGWAAARKASRKTKTVAVRLISGRAPTAERWRSFGWTVTASRPYAVSDREV